MTPRQIHALERAVQEMGYMLEETGHVPESDGAYMDARRALAQLWHDYREQQAAARIKPCRRELQTVPR